MGSHGFLLFSAAFAVQRDMFFLRITCHLCQIGDCHILSHPVIDVLILIDVLSVMFLSYTLYVVMFKRDIQYSNVKFPSAMPI